MDDDLRTSELQLREMAIGIDICLCISACRPGRIFSSLIKCNFDQDTLSVVKLCKLTGPEAVVIPTYLSESQDIILSGNYKEWGNWGSRKDEQKFQEAVLTAGPRKVNIKHIYI